ncbi:MAG: IclR family transcriptional regulator [Asticcacaulis sp.]
MAKTEDQKLKDESQKRQQKSDVPSVEKALDIIELLSLRPNGLTMNELTRELDRSMGEIYRIVVYLTNRGYVQRDESTDRYGMTLRMFELSHQFGPTDNILKLASPILEKISFRTEQSCHLAVLYKASILVLASSPSPRPASYSVKAGATFPFMTTSSGVVILSFLEEDKRDRYLASLPLGEQNVLMERLMRIKDQGYETAPSTLMHGVTNLSAPVFSRDGVVAAITTGFVLQYEQRCSLNEMAKEIRDGAKELSQLLGAGTDSLA